MARTSNTQTTDTPEEIEAWRAKIVKYDMKTAEAARVAKEAFFEPLKTALDNDCGKAFYAALDALRTSFDDDEYPENEAIRTHLGAILMILPVLSSSAGVTATVIPVPTLPTPSE